jgi:hypothetical protein
MLYVMEPYFGWMPDYSLLFLDIFSIYFKVFSRLLPLEKLEIFIEQLISTNYIRSKKNKQITNYMIEFICEEKSS